MKNNYSPGKYIVISILVILILLSATIVPANVASNANLKNNNGFQDGIPWKPFIPLEKVTFIDFDKESYLDDFAYLSAIPASVFSDDNTLYCNPLLFLQPEGSYPDTDEYRFLNDYTGTHYLMEDWMGYCGGSLDKIMTVNVDKKDLESSWTAKEIVEIDENNPYSIASKIALEEWSYANDAVVAVIEEDFEKPTDVKTSGSVSGKISGDVASERIKVKRSYGPSPEYEKFYVEERYKYLRVDLWYPAIVVNSKILQMAGLFGKGWITIPSIDPDMQLYCKYDGDWMQTSAASEMTITHGPYEQCLSYVYNPGDWRVGVTNMPTEGGDDLSYTQDILGGKLTVYGDMIEAFRNYRGKEVTSYYCDITKYPGEVIEIPDLPSFGCGDASFNLTWDNAEVDLGLSIIGPSGEEVESVLVEEQGSQEIHFDQLGECNEDECYKIVVYALESLSRPIDFEVKYSWEQKTSEKEGDCLASACEGAVLASVLNSPLLYVSTSNVPQTTINTLNKLGTKNVYLVNLGGHLSKNAKNKLKESVKIRKEYTEYKDIYDKIMDETNCNDVIFSTIDPWSYWLYKEKAGELKPEGEFEKAFYFGPATYAAALHGSPLLLVDNHPELSSSIVWHNEFWKKHANGYTSPAVAPMFLTGNRVYKFLKEYGFDRDGAEYILTVAGQYDIGPSWSRVFAGVGYPGNIIGTPVDTSNWITRNIFYPALIFENPALQGPVTLENGSMSERVQPSLIPFRPLQGLRTRLFKQPFGSNFVITRPSQEEEYTYPVLHTYGCYGHRFNERGSLYWDTKYHTRNGIIPGETISYDEIDRGIREQYEGISGCYYADISESVVVPFYADKAGYDNAFSTNYETTIKNLNQGVISWYMVLHGNSGNGGELSWFSPRNVEELLIKSGASEPIAKLAQLALGIPFGLYPMTEVNPWRGYDHFWGSTNEPDTATLNSEIGLIMGILGIGNPDGPLGGGRLKLGLDLVPSNIPLFRFNRDNYFDGLVGPYSITAMLTQFHYDHTGTEVDDTLENLHSMSFHAESCLIACKYLHIAFMRHGSVMQELDPWPTSYWGGVAFQQTPKDIAMGKTIGQSYAEGRCEIGIQYLFEEGEDRDWWWDSMENVVLFSDPKLRIWNPSTEWDFDGKNNWDLKDISALSYNEEFNVDGHMPFGAADHPHEKQPISLLEQYAFLIIITALILILVAVVFWKKKFKK